MSQGDFPHILQIKSIRLENFRSYQSKKIPIHGDIVIFIGANGVGKTSVLESISLMSNLKSFRGANDKDMIYHGSPQYLVELEYENYSGSHKMSMGFGGAGKGEKTERRMRMDSQQISRISDFIGHFQTVVFAPDDINIVEGGPAERRRFIDIVLASLYTEYLVALQMYRKILKLRSACLYRPADRIDEKLVASMDNDLVKFGSIIQKHRETFIDEFQEIFSRLVEYVSSGSDAWKMQYQPSIAGGGFSEKYRLALENVRGEDIKTRQTTRGIHRDRILFTDLKSGENDITKIGSQGQKRTVVLALKMAQFEYTRKRKSEKPVLLIDDVLNELDIERRKNFINFLHEAGQAFITATDISALEDFIKNKKDVAEIQILYLEKT